ncbi:hypothetical protein [Xenorhabdus szentirmaii]|uniref:hypothetical protein n=1 Tax=Xenorhabdus szentirmaii TaxID=290112 RepID=UPI000C055D50|nr:hypothetical protein [Xenorhabdus szentirmaii]PHM43600.1 hypothetical protein Xszus_03400 [Xenorhabdus szentirmaii]
MTNSNNTSSKCALCRKKAKLQDSHFIPKFIYKKMNEYKDKNHKIRAIDNKMIDYNLGKQIKKHLLCKDCEGMLSRNGEDYFARKAFSQEDNILHKIWKSLYYSFSPFIPYNTYSLHYLYYLREVYGLCDLSKIDNFHNCYALEKEEEKNYYIL